MYECQKFRLESYSILYPKIKDIKISMNYNSLCVFIF